MNVSVNRLRNFLEDHPENIEVCREIAHSFVLLEKMIFVHLSGRRYIRIMRDDSECGCHPDNGTPIASAEEFPNEILLKVWTLEEVYAELVRLSTDKENVFICGGELLTIEKDA